MFMPLGIDFAEVNAFTIFLAIVIGFLPGFVWLLFYLKEDMHPEPKRLLALTFLAGMLSALAALVLESAVNIGILPIFNIYRLSLISLFVISIIEEVVKFGAAYLCVRKSPYLDEPVDAMIYMLTAGLGFATVENLGAISGVDSAQTAFVSGVFQVASLRFIGATLLHSLVGAIVGYFWAMDIRDFKITKYVYIGLGIAVVLHTVFNSLILYYGEMMYLLIFLSIIGFFVLGDFEKLRRRTI